MKIEIPSINTVPFAKRNIPRGIAMFGIFAYSSSVRRKCVGKPNVPSIIGRIIIID